MRASVAAHAFLRRLAGGLAALALCVVPFATPALDLDAWRDRLEDLDVDRAVELGRKAVRATRMLDEAEEITLGRELTAMLLGAMPPLADPSVQAYVNRLGLYLALGSARPNLPWRFVVTDTESVGAFATPGGNVLVTKGLFRLVSDEHELAGVLAHEIGHVVARHHLKAIMQRARAGLAREVAANLAREYAGHNPQAARALLDAGTALYASGLSHQDEFAADLMGMRTAAAAGYDPTGLMLALMTIDTLAADEPRAALMFSTHPDTGARVDRLGAELSTLSVTPASTLRDDDRFQRIRARLAAD